MNRSYSPFLFLLCCWLLTACAHQPTPSLSIIENPEIAQTDSKPSNIEENPEQVILPDEVVIPPRRPIAIALAPALYRSVAYLPLLTLLSKRKEIEIYAASDFALILVALHLQGISQARIEFILYKFFNHVEDIIPYSKDWYTYLEQDLLIHFKGKKFSSLKKKLIVPFLNLSNKKWQYASQGDLYRAISYSIKSTSPDHFTRASVSPIEFDWIAFAHLTKRGQRVVYLFDALHNEIQLEEPNDFTTGFYNALSIAIKKSSEKVDHYVSLPSFETSIDFKNIPPDFMLKSEEFLKYHLKEADL